MAFYFLPNAKNILLLIFCGIFSILFTGCASHVIKMPKTLPDIVSVYKSVTVTAGYVGMFDSGVSVKKGDCITIMAKGEMDLGGKLPTLRCGHYVRGPVGCLLYRIGKKGYASKYYYYYLSWTVSESGNIYLGYAGSEIDSYGKPLNPNYYYDDTGYFSVDIIVWKKNDPILIADFLEEIRRGDPQNTDLKKLVEFFKGQKELLLAEKKLSQEVEETKKAISTLKEYEVFEAKDLKKEERIEVKPDQIDTTPQVSKEKEILLPEKKTMQEVKETKKTELALEKKEVQKEKEKEILEQKQVSEVTGKKLQEEANEIKKALKEKEVSEIKYTEKEKQIAELKDRLNTALQALKELEELKKKLAEEIGKRDNLAARIDYLEEGKKKLSQKPPAIVIANPRDGISVESECVNLSGVAEDDNRIVQLDILINNQLVKRRDHRRIQPDLREIKRIDFLERICLKEGKNEITIVAENDDGLTAKKNISVQLAKKKEAAWAVVIGVNKYKNLPMLKYAVNDAREFYSYLVEVNLIPKDHASLLLDEEVTLDRIRSILGTYLRQKAGKNDMVIIYFAGHGATEVDPSSPDGDGLEKYILPHNADPKDLYATAMPMNEISRIFQRISSENVIFISDTCYSGASGGRTITPSGFRASLSGAFLDRLSHGRGRIILTASDANEVSVEKDELRHGVFTYYLLEALRGKGDMDGDGFITVDEVHRYVSIKVPQATEQNQHPVKKGEMKGQIVLGIVR